jgi:hypothetical protein
VTAAAMVEPEQMLFLVLTLVAVAAPVDILAPVVQAAQILKTDRQEPAAAVAEEEAVEIGQVALVVALDYLVKEPAVEVEFMVVFTHILKVAVEAVDRVVVLEHLEYQVLIIMVAMEEHTVVVVVVQF